MKYRRVKIVSAKCWSVVCSKCGTGISTDGDYFPNFGSKEDAVEYLEEEGGDDYIVMDCDCFKEKPK